VFNFFFKALNLPIFFSTELASPARLYPQQPKRHLPTTLREIRTLTCSLRLAPEHSTQRTASISWSTSTGATGSPNPYVRRLPFHRRRWPSSWLNSPSPGYSVQFALAFFIWLSLPSKTGSTEALGSEPNRSAAACCFQELVDILEPGVYKAARLGIF
jgi:hypothetical protein